MKNFEGFGLNPALVQSLARMNYQTPTPIQAQAIPLALKGRDIMGTAQTGTGKTAAFAIPLVEKLLYAGTGKADHGHHAPASGREKRD
jgi:superfamily II DNA/RNA helicase